MRHIHSNIPLALGDLINIKGFLEPVKNQFDFIKLTFHKSLLEEGVKSNSQGWSEKRQLWEKYLNDVGRLFFSESPYVLNNGEHQFRDTGNFVKEFNIQPVKPELGHLLCVGEPLDIKEGYIVITTKVREISKGNFYPLSINLWSTLAELSKKYKIVILGEREVEMRKEYEASNNSIFGIYEQIVSNVPSERVLDLTVPALGETVSNLAKIQQDCLIMKQARFVITLGIGGNFCMATAVSDMVIGFRADSHWLADTVFNREYPNAIVTKDWSYFINNMKKYL